MYTDTHARIAFELAYLSLLDALMFSKWLEISDPENVSSSLIVDDTLTEKLHILDLNVRVYILICVQNTSQS